MKKRTRWVIALIAVLVAVLLALGVFLLSRNRTPAALHATGIIDGIEVNLSSKVAGKISRICCNEGDKVQAGQVAITLESDDIKASLEQAVAGVERAGADVKAAEASIGNSRANLLAAEADVKGAGADLEKAAAQMEEAKRQAERREDLYKGNLIAKESRDQSMTEYAVNAATYDSLKEKLNAARSRKTAAAGQLDAAVSQWNASKAMRKEAEANRAFFRSKLADTSIVTPITGTVIFKALETGEMVSPGATVLTIVDLNSLFARVDIDETKIGRVVLNHKAFVSVEGVPGKTFEGKISEIGRYAEFATQRDVVRGREDIKTFRVKVRVDDPSGVLKPGMTVEVAFPREPLKRREDPEMPKGKAIVVSDITKKFGPIAAVDHVDFEVDEGEFFGFLGPNGAGKTTLIRMLTTLLRPTSGKAIVSGCDVTEDPAEVRKRIGVVPQAMTSDLDLTGRENMDLYGRFYGIRGRERKERIGYLLEMVGLTHRANDLVATYSGGMRRRLEIARVLVHRPPLLFLDEPTIGLDPQSRRVVWDFLKKLIEGDSMTIFLTTHYMEEAEILCGRVGIIDAGKIIALGTPSALKADIPGNDIVSLTVGNLSPELVRAIGELPFVHKAIAEEDSLRVYVDNGSKNLPALIDDVRRAGGAILSASVHEQSLEDVFIHHTGKSIREEEAKKVSFLLGAGVPQSFGR